MEDTTEWFACEQCDGEFSVQTDVSMKIIYCCFCGEPLDDIDWEYDDENTKRESEGT